MSKKDKLLGWDVSPYTAKVRSYFNYKQIPYDYNPPSAYTLARKVQPAVGKMIMPTVFKSNGEILQDSSVIIDHYETLFSNKSVIPNGPNQAFATLFIEIFADEWLPMAALHYRWNYKENYDFIISEFGKNALPYFPAFIQKTVAKQFAGKMSGYLPILGITEKMRSHLESTVEKLLSLLDCHFESHRFLLGSQPTIGDFALYGPLYAHLDRDPVPADLIKKHQHLHNWLMTMNGSFSNVTGELEANDSVPDTLIPVLAEMINLETPLLLQTTSAIEQWAQDNPDTNKLPQRLGDSELSLNGKTESRYNLTYGYWMLQRMNDKLANLGELSGSIKPLSQSVHKLGLPIQVELKKARLMRVA
ncbi:MAG: glutathione S-transferase [Pseudomonadales bacterium]|nr:glutathione S-transferase [Pseudomonadales bacterium]